MSYKTSIEWTATTLPDGTITQGGTWNPIKGCSRVSEGCRFCYAETFAERWRGVPGHPYEQGFDLRLVPEKLEEPIKWKKGRRIFVNSMSDLFHEGVPVEYIEQVFDVMLRAPQHTYQILTKRHERTRELMTGPLNRFSGYPHIWLGVSAENAKYGLPRIDALRNTPSAVRFVSFEPLLGYIHNIDLTGIHLAIVGGESGHGCRPMDPDWARSIYDQCRLQGVKFFMKQMGGSPNKRHNLEDFPPDIRIREMP